jgi:hypothetical protein
MMDQRWIVQLLARCEAAVGHRLGLIRRHLQSDQWLGAIWELILLDAAAALGSVKYEPTVAGSRPDLQLDSHSGVRLYIEAAFLQSEKSDHARKVDYHLVFRVLKKKGSKAERAGTDAPFVAFLGTDRVFDIASSRHVGGVAVEEAVVKAFGAYPSLSAVVLVSIFARPEIFKPLQKRPRPWLYANPFARVSLTNKGIDVINRFDFERWPFDRFIRPDAKRPELREALSRNSWSGSWTAESASSFVPPQDDRNVPYPCWTYVWRFNRLRIAKIGNEYWLFNGREFLNVTAKTPEQVAEAASELFQIFPAHVMGPNGPEPHPDPGVPADLGKWILELPDKSD